MSKDLKTFFQKLSDSISAAEATANQEELERLDGVIGTALAAGEINLPEAGELTVDIELAQKALQRDDYLDEGYAAIAQGL